MQLQSETNGLDLYADCLWLCGILSTDTTTYPIKDFVRNANFAGDRVSSLIMKSDAKWEWDDSNNTDLPIGTTTLVAEQQDYAIPVTQLKIIRVRVKDAQGNYQIVEPTNRKDLINTELTSTSGMPRKYDLLGNSLMLYPKPKAGDVTLSAGVEVQFQRGFSYFVYTDTTKVPGFATPYHRLISLYSALDYCESNELDKRAVRCQNKINRMENDLVEHYASRNNDAQPSISVVKDDYGQSAL